MSLIPIVRKVSGNNRYLHTLVFEVIAHAIIDDRFQEICLWRRWVITKGYATTSVGKSRLYLHQLVWVTAGNVLPVLPLMTLDHIDRNKLNNQLSNLRIADRSTQRRNTGLQKNNTSGLKGVSFDKQTGKWEAGIYAEGKRQYLGRFTTKEEASATYKAAHNYYFPGVPIVE